MQLASIWCRSILAIWNVTISWTYFNIYLIYLISITVLVRNLMKNSYYYYNVKYGHISKVSHSTFRMSTAISITAKWYLYRLSKCVSKYSDQRRDAYNARTRHSQAGVPVRQTHCLKKKWLYIHTIQFAGPWSFFVTVIKTSWNVYIFFIIYQMGRYM